MHLSVCACVCVWGGLSVSVCARVHCHDYVFIDCHSLQILLSQELGEICRSVT